MLKLIAPLVSSGIEGTRFTLACAHCRATVAAYITSVNCVRVFVIPSIYVCAGKYEREKHGGEGGLPINIMSFNFCFLSC